MILPLSAPASGESQLTAMVDSLTSDTVLGQSQVSQTAAKKTLRQLEAEELRIRKDSSLTKKERMRRLHEIWKQQREVMAESAG